MSATVWAYDVTITNETSGYSYKAYQIFTGNLSGSTLSNIDWGDGVTETAKDNLYSRYGLDGTTGKEKTARKVAEAIAAVGTTDAEKKAEADAIATLIANTTTNGLGTAHNLAYSSTDKNYKVTGLSAGYYLVVNDGVPNGTTDTGAAFSDYIVEVVKDVNVAPKSSIPTSDKAVSDDADQGTAQKVASDGAKTTSAATASDYESVDHDLYESFQYTLTAMLPDDANLDSYSSYQLIFNDEMTEGVSFLGISSVTATHPKDATTIEYTLSENVRSATETAPVKGNGANLSWTLTINDLTQYVTTLRGTVVTVVFNACLNEKAAVVGPGTQTASNNNTYYLQYSNNPNSTGTGKTTPDTVYTFTYEMPNTKYANNTSTPLANAGFSILDSSDNAISFVPVDSSGNVVTEGLTQANASTAPVTPSTVVAYRLAKSGETGAITVLGTLSNGKFDVRGLDAGTYKLHEVFTPAGYNTAADSTIVITGNTTEETAGGQSVMSMTQDGNTSTNNGVINNSGSVLPSTGGMGTTIFYVIGAILVLGAGILLVTRRRVSAN